MTNCHGKLRFAILLVVATSLLFVVSNAGVTAGGVSTFVRLQFGSDVSVEVPRNWVFLDQNIRQHLNPYSEAAAKPSGIDVNQGNKQPIPLIGVIYSGITVTA